MARDQRSKWRLSPGCVYSPHFVRKRRRGRLLPHPLLAGHSAGRRHPGACWLLDVINNAFGYVAIQNRIEPEALIERHYETQMLAMPPTLSSEDHGETQVLGDSLKELPAEDLLAILTDNISAGRWRALNAESLLTERSQNELYELVLSLVVRPTVVE
jgi:hypothetical protein